MIELLGVLAAGLAGLTLMASILDVPLPRRRRRIRHGPRRREQQRQWLRQAGAPIAPWQFTAISATTGALALVATLALTGAWAVALVPGVLCGLLPTAYFAQRRRQRLAAITASWPDGLRDLTAAVRAHMTLHQALCELARHGPEPLRDAFAHYRQIARVSGERAALEQIKEELADPTSDRILEVLILARERGPHNLPQILEELTSSIDRDLQTAKEIHRGKQEPRMAMTFAATLPWGLLILATVGDTFLADFYRTGPGNVVVIIAAVFTAAGVGLVQILFREPAEPRLFAARDEEAAS